MKAGVLEIEMIANIARLQQDLDQARRAVTAMGADVGRSVRAANDNLASIGTGGKGGLGQLSRDIARVREELDPIGVATARYNRELDILNAAVEHGKLSQREYAIALDQARARLDEAANKHSAFAAQAREAAEAEATAARQAGEYAARADALTAKLDPLHAAQRQFNKEVAEAGQLLAAGAIGEDVYAAAVAAADQALRSRIATLDGSEKAANDATVAENTYANAIEQLRQQADPSRAAMARLTSQMDLAEQAFRDGRLEADEYARIIHNLQTQADMLSTGGLRGVAANGQIAAHHMLNLGFQFQDLTIQMMAAAASGDVLKMAFIAVAQQGSQIYGIMQQTGLGVKGFVSEVATMAGIIKVSGDAALTSAAAQAAAHQAVVASLATRAEANVATTAAELALAEAAIANATTADAAAMAQTALAAAMQRSAVAATENATAQAALATAQATTAEASAAASAATVTRLGAVGVAGLAVAGILATIGAGFALGARTINQGNDGIIKGLGLTEKQLERVKKSGVDTGVTIGDTFFAFFDVVGDRLGEAFDGPLKWLSDAWSSTMDFITKYGALAIKNWVGFWTGAIGAIMAAWRLLPGAIGDILTQIVNGAIKGLEWLINKHVDGINLLIEAANKALGTSFDPLGAVDLGQMENKFAGSGKAFGDALMTGFKDGFAGGVAAVDRVFADIAKRAVERRKNALREAGGDAEKTPKGPKTQAEKFADIVGDVTRNIAMLEAQTKALELSDDAALQLTNQQKLLNDAQDKGITLTDRQRAVLIGLADDLTAAQIALRKAQNLKAANDSYDQQIRAIKQAGEQIGVYGSDLVELTAYQELLNKATNGGKDAIDDLTDARLRGKAAHIAANKADNDSRQFMVNLTRDAEAAQKAMEQERGEIGLTGAALAAYRYEQAALTQAARDHIKLSPEKLAAIKATAAAYGTMRQETDDLLNAQQKLVDQFSAIADAAHSAAERMSSAFGSIGGAIGDVVSILADYGEKQQQIQAAVHAGTLTQAEGERELANVQLDSMGKAISAAKGLFKEHSTGYKAMAAAEKAFALVQMANTAINIAAGAAKMFASLGPFGFPAVAAMIAVMAGLGAAVAGGGGGYKPPTAEEVQAAQGTGSVLGDSKTQSGSISNALELMLKNSSKDLEYSNEMVRSLRAIESNIGALSSLLARQLNVSGGSFDTSGLGLGSSTKTSTIGNLLMPFRGLLNDVPVIGGLLSGIAKALFGTKKTVTLLDQGITFASASVEDIINGGMVGQIYQDVQTQTKKKFLGVTTSNKTKVTTSYGEMDSDMERQVALIIGSLRSGIIDAAGVLGVDGAAATLDAFKVELGKISLKDLSGDEIQKQLEAVFSKLGDDMASTVLPGLVEFQKVGEGTFETLARLAKDYATVDTELTSIGMTFGAVGLASVGARENLIDLFGGLDAFSEQTAFFRENFLTEAEQMAPIVSAVSAEMARLGQSGVKTKEQFKDLVLGLDLSSESGSEMYASLMAVAPAFAKVIEYMGSLDAELGETGKTAEELAAIAKERRNLEIDLMDALGQSEEALAARRADALAALDESNRALQQQVWAAQDAATANAKLAQEQTDAANAAKALADQRLGLEGQILQLLGDTDEIRTRELATLDASLRPLQERIYLLQDEADAAAAAKAIADQRLSLEGQILQLLGDTEETRARELAALDASLRPLQERIYLLQDEADAAAKAKAVAEERYGLETQLYQALGDTATIRARELAQLDPANRALQQRIWGIEDQQAAEEAATQARQTLIDGYRSEASALGDTAEKFRDFAKTIAEFRDGLLSGGSAGGFAQIEAQFQRTAAMARLGNEASLSSFTTDAKAYLDAATARAGSRDEAQLALARVIAASNGAIGGANGVADMATAQLAAAEAAAAQLEVLNGTAAGLDAALDELKAQQSDEVVPAVTETVETSVGKLREEVTLLREEAADREEQMIAILTKVMIAASKLERTVSAASDNDTIMVGTRPGEPLAATIAGSVTVDNTTANPVPVDQVP